MLSQSGAAGDEARDFVGLSQESLDSFRKMAFVRMRQAEVSALLGRTMEGLVFASVRFRLSAMMFLQYAVAGAWAPVMSQHMITNLGFTKFQAGMVFSILALTSMVAPFIFGHLADRLVAAQKLLAAAHMGGAVALVIAAMQTSHVNLAVVMAVYGLLCTPTMALTNTMCFRNLQHSEREFSRIRVWGTVGWIFAGLSLSFWRSQVALDSISDGLLLAAVFSVLFGMFSLTLPHTPPCRQGSNPLAFIGALKLLTSPSFLVFTLVSFVAATQMYFYLIMTAPFLIDVGITDAALPATMTIAQGMEIIAMALILPILLPRLGIKKMLSLGLIMWPILYFLFALGQPQWLVVSALSLHGLNFAFYFVVGVIYVNSAASDDIKASAQGLIAILLGMGAYVGSLFVGWVGDRFQLADGSADWRSIFIVPCIVTSILAVAFIVTFREPAAHPATEPQVATDEV